MKIEFFRKRSGKIVKFNPEKIRSAVSRAIAEADAILPKPLPENLDLYIKDKVLFLLNYEDSEFYVKPDTVGSRVPKLEDVQDAVEYSLQHRWQDRPAGYSDTEAKLLHDLYANYRKEREKARAALRVVRKEKSKVDVTDKGMLLQEGSTGTLDGWDRSRLEKDLEDVLPDSEKAPVIAKRVERAILKSGLRTVSSDLVTEMANNELTAMGIPARLNSGRGYFVDKDFIDGLMYAKSRENSNVTSNNPEAINMAMSEYLLKNWAFDNVFSKDVVHAHQFGLIYLHDLGSITKVYQFSGKETEVTVYRNGEPCKKTLRQLWDESAVPEQQLNDTQFCKDISGMNISVEDRGARTKIERLVLSREVKDAVRLHLSDGITQAVTCEHGVVVLRDGKYMIVRADEIRATDKLVRIRNERRG